MTESTEEFFGKFSKDYLPSYDFFRLVFAKVALNGITLVNSYICYVETPEKALSACCVSRTKASSRSVAPL